MGVLQNHIADAQVIGHPAQVFQFEWFALAGQIVKFPSSLRFEDALLGESLKQGNRSGWLRWPFHLAALDGFKPLGGPDRSSRSIRSNRSSPLLHPPPRRVARGGKVCPEALRRRGGV